MLTRPQRANILGTGVHAVNIDTAVDYLDACIRSGKKGYVCVTGVHGIIEALRSREFCSVLDDALLVTPDGMPTVWIGRSQRHTDMRRVFGPDLMHAMCSRSLKRGNTHFLYGGKPGVAEDLKKKLESRFPGIKIVGMFTPPFRPLTSEEQSQLADLVARLKPDIIWLGISTPKQEMFMAEMIHRLDCKLLIGVGAAFDIHTGRIKDAPAWAKEAGLQWLHRLSQEPRRLWKRYAINNASFAWHLALKATGIRRYDLRPEYSSQQQSD
jgi:N-acetylglucosaminyldiphosphoundecaprenol N-acetyl-beta-D-mannosaminyltransferase